MITAYDPPLIDNTPMTKDTCASADSFNYDNDGLTILIEWPAT